MKSKPKPLQYCKLEAAGEQGRANICCCLIAKENGAYEDPCAFPIDAFGRSNPDTVPEAPPGNKA